jgi:hypothetical protein
MILLPIESGIAGPPEGLPAGLLAALDERGASVERWWREGPRTYVEATGDDGPLFARASSRSADVAVLEHEAEARRALAGQHAFRVPAVLATGRDWMLEQRVVSEPIRGTRVVGAAARAAVALAEAPVPSMTGTGPSRTGAQRIDRVLRIVRGPLPVRDLLNARRVLASSSLPRAVAHGDFHEGNVLFAGGDVWLVDWELSGPKPAGYDLMQLWTTLSDSADREQVFAIAEDWLGRRHRQALAALRYVLLVHTIAAKVAPNRLFDLDETGAGILLELLPRIRAEAGFRPAG